MQIAQHSACRETQKTCVRRQRAPRPAACSFPDFLGLLLLPQKQSLSSLWSEAHLLGFGGLGGAEVCSGKAGSLGPWAVPGARGGLGARK